MTWRAHTWEFVIAVFSWPVAIMALGGLGALALYDAYKRRRTQR